MISVILFEVIFILLLVLANGLFAMSEMAVVSARKARLQQWANEGDARARAALKLANMPERFLSTIQTGITMVGILAGAFGGATIAEQVGAGLSAIPALGAYGEAVGVGVVVLGITYLSLVIGELVPKRLALNNPERIASIIARPMNALSVIASPAVKLLEVSTEMVLKILRVESSNDPTITEEEIKVLIEEGTRSGVFDKAEQYLVRNVFRLGDRRASALMTHRLDIVWVDIDAPLGEIRSKIAGSPYSRFPVCQGRLDKLLGMIKAKELLGLDAATADWKTLIRQPLVVPESRTALEVLESFKTSHTHMAIIIDEYGAVEGLVTTNDILEAIVGDILTASAQSEIYAVQREDGSWLLDGMLPLDEFKEIFRIQELPGENQGVYQTLAGFILTHLGRIPSVADHFEWRGLRFEVVDMDGKRIDKVLIAPLEKPISNQQL